MDRGSVGDRVGYKDRVADALDGHAYTDGVDVGFRLTLLSTYLGHVHPASTFWYLSAAPELMAQAARRLEQQQEGQR